MNSNVLNMSFQLRMNEKEQKNLENGPRGVLKMHETTIVFIKKDGKN